LGTAFKNIRFEAFTTVKIHSVWYLDHDAV